MAASPGSGSPYDGRLDLDDLDVGPTSLDVLGDDEPRLGERVAARLESAGVTPWLRRHRPVLAGVAVVTALALVVAGTWWVRRPPPLPSTVRLLAKVTGPDPTAEVRTDPAGHPASVTQALSLTTAERPGVEVAVALAGPGLSTPVEAYVVMDRSRPDASVTLDAGLDCATPEATTAVLGAGIDDYVVQVRRTAPEGETRVDPVPIIGTRTLAQLVRRSCLQLAADRDLRATSVTAATVPGVVAADIDVAVTNASTREWSGLRISPGAMPTVINNGARSDLGAGQSGHVLARLWPQDCGDPTAAIATGLPVQADLGPDGNPPSTSLGSPGFRLALPAQAQQTVAQALVAACGTELPRLTIDRVRLRNGGEGGLAGVLDLGVTIEAPDADHVEAEAAGAFAVGQLTALESPVAVRDGRATLRLRWTLPACPVVQRAGRATLAVTLAGDPRRPYLLPLRGDELRTYLTRLCGDETATAVAG
ncbi:MAG: hypothetical protein U0S36_06005 [Candidatus Nanopelagicales bacterium]